MSRDVTVMFAIARPGDEDDYGGNDDANDVNDDDDDRSVRVFGVSGILGVFVALGTPGVLISVE